MVTRADVAYAIPPYTRASDPETPIMSRESSELEDELPALEVSASLQARNYTSMVLSDDEAGHVHTPPERVAARFYRSTNNRRRTSAASSRRNSLSSQQSHHSNRSFRAAFQSNHVAQHLRRASILESRKARLADRAAHAEQVRLRAALAKAAPRVTNTEEKALAAQQAREKYLAKVAAACAEEVNRAKKVAEEMKERKAAEERRCRMELEEKHAEAEKRRLGYKKTQRKPRTASLPTTETKNNGSSPKAPLTNDAAACTIQRAWRHRKRQLDLKKFSDLDLTIDRIRNIDFMDASTFLAEPSVIESTARIMNVLQIDKEADPEGTYVRRFLSAFMILGHPTDIFNKHGQQEQDLIEKAKELLISCESALASANDSSHSRVSSTELETLSQAYATYLTAFDAWKTKDASVLIATMVDQFVALDGIWQSVKDDTRGEVANDYREGIRNQQIVLLSKVKKLAGPDRANVLIKKAIRESRRARPQRGPIGDVRPRPVASPDAGSSGPNSATAASVISENEASNQDLELSELSRIFSVVPPNRVLVHELQIDPNFKIEVSPHSNVRNTLNREVCNSMRRGVQEGQGDVWTLAVAENIRKRLLKLLKPGNSMHRILSEVLDPQHIQGQLQQGMFSYDKFFAFMADILPRLCAPIRDDEVQKFASILKTEDEGIDAMIEKLFGLLHIIDLMSLDYTNYMLQQAAPTLLAEAAGYEQRMFEQDIAQNKVTLQKTKRWWRHASVNVLTELGSNDAAGRASFQRIYARGLVDLTIGTGPLHDSDLPETLQLDKARFSRIRVDMLRFTLVGAVLLTAKNLLKRDVRSQWKPEAKRVLESVKDGFDNSDGNLGARILSIVGTTHGMPQTSRDSLAGVIERFLSECNAGRLVDPVLKLLFQRLKMHIFNRLAASTSVERVRMASTASEGLAGIGLSEFIGQVGCIAEELAKVGSIDQAAHGGWYRQITEELERMGAAEA